MECNEAEAILFDSYHNPKSFYRYDFTEWVFNSEAGHDVTITNNKITIRKFRPNRWILMSNWGLSPSTDTSGLCAKTANFYVKLGGMDEKRETIFNSNYQHHSVVGGSGDTYGWCRGVCILPFSKSLPAWVETSYPEEGKYRGELPFSAYVWDHMTYVDNTTVQLGSEVSALRGAGWGAGYNTYGRVYSYQNTKVTPNWKSFPAPYGNWELSIGLFTGNTEVVGEDGLIDVSDAPITIEMPMTGGVDMTTQECWDVYCGDMHIYHKDRTVDNALVEYGLAKKGRWDSNGVLRDDNDKYLLINCESAKGLKYIIPDTIDFEEVLQNRYCYFWNCSPQNMEFWDKVKEYYSNTVLDLTKIPRELIEDPTGNRFGVFSASNIDEITIKLGGTVDTQFLNIPNMFSWSGVKTINLDTTNLHYTNIFNGQMMFRGCGSLQTINHTGTGFAKDCSGMFEGCGSLKTIPNTMLDWRIQSAADYNGANNVGYLFDNCGSLETVPMSAGTTEETRCTDPANIIKPSVMQQFISGSPNLTYLGWCIDMSIIVPEPRGNSWRTFMTPKLTDARIKGLNHGDWYFDASAEGRSNLSSLDATSVKYLIDNLSNLASSPYYTERGYTRKAPYILALSSYATQSITQNITHFTGQGNNTLTLSSCKTIPIEINIPTGATVTVTSPAELKIYIPGPVLEYTTDKVLNMEGATLLDTNVLTSGTYYLVQETESQKVLKVESTGDWTIKIPDALAWSPAIPNVSSAELHCPETWRDKITNDMVQSANTKGWTIYMGGTIKTV